ncbi:hypothetical protein V8C42DRAFT_349552 [Trichoderma barbatum]
MKQMTTLLKVVDIINVVSVVGAVNVRQWIESNSGGIQESLYWRQAFNCRTSELSSVALVCKCRTLSNPDETLIGCSNKSCEEWMHYDCLLDDVLTRVYDRLGTDIPHKSEKPAIKEETKEDTKDDPKEGTKGDLLYGLLSPSVEGEDRKSPIVANSEIKDQVHVQRDDESSKDTETLTLAPLKPSDMSSKSALAKRGKKTWGGLFEATLKINEGPMVWQVTDLREGIEGGKKKWTEPGYCLLCDTLIE